MFADLRTRLRALFRRDAVEVELDDELRFHFEKQVEKYVASGLPRAEAMRRAQRLADPIPRAVPARRRRSGTRR